MPQDPIDQHCDCPKFIVPAPAGPGAHAQPREAALMATNGYAEYKAARTAVVDDPTPANWRRFEKARRKFAPPVWKPGPGVTPSPRPSLTELRAQVAAYGRS